MKDGQLQVSSNDWHPGPRSPKSELYLLIVSGLLPELTQFLDVLLDAFLEL